MNAPEEGTKKTKWQPYTKAAQLMKDRNNMNYFNNKRARVDKNKDNSQTGKKQNTNNHNEKLPPTNVWTKQPPTSDSATSRSDETMEEIKAHVQEQIERNNKIIRDEIQETNSVTNKRIGNLDKKLDAHITTVQYDLHEIKEQNRDTKDSVKTNVDRLESIFWKMWSRFEDPPDDFDGMEYEKSRQDLALKRGLDQVDANSSQCDFSISHDDINLSVIPENSPDDILLMSQVPGSTHVPGDMDKNKK
jgi:hypothetical protein